MNTPPEAPAWYLPAIARLAALPANDYPDASYRPLKQAIARLVGVGGDQVAVGAGCDEIILLVAALGLGPGRVALVHRPTYQLYSVAARNLGAELIGIEPRNGIEPDWDAFLDAAPRAHVAFVCSPNNPTGHEASADLLRAVCAACPGIVLCDQAYLELGGVDHLPLVAEHDNLIIGRTFSKGFGLGAARVGYAIAQPALTGALDSLRPPGSLSSWSAAVGEIACTQETEMRERVTRTLAERDRLAEGLRAAGVTVDAVAGNYVLGRLPTPDTFARLSELGLVVRTFAHEPLLAGHFRATVSNPDANDRLMTALAGTRRRLGPRSASGQRGAACRGAARHEGDAHRLHALARRLGTRADRDRPRLPRSPADGARVLVDGRPRPALHGRSLDRRAPHARGLRDRARRGARCGARRPRRSDALRRCARTTRRVARRGDDRPVRSRHRPHRAGLQDERVGQVPTSLLPHFLDTFARRGAHRSARPRRGRGRSPSSPRRRSRRSRSRCAPPAPRTPRAAGISSTKGVL